MHAAFKLQFGKDALPDHFEHSILDAAEITFAAIHQFGFPALKLRVTRVHLQKVGREQCRLITAGTRADFDDRRRGVRGIFRQELNLQIVLELYKLFAKLCALLFGHRPHVGIGGWIGDQRLGFGDLLRRRAISIDNGYHRRQFGVLLRQLHIDRAARPRGKLRLDRMKAILKAREFVLGNHGAGE